MIGWFAVTAYAAGFVVTWVVLARYWMGEFGHMDKTEPYAAAGWALIGAVIWPVVAVTLALGGVVKRVAS